MKSVSKYGQAEIRATRNTFSGVKPVVLQQWKLQATYLYSIALVRSYYNIDTLNFKGFGYSLHVICCKTAHPASEQK